MIATYLPCIQELRLQPVEAFRRICALPHALFLDSALRHPTLGRYSYVTADPFAVLWSRGREVEWRGRLPGCPPLPNGTPFQALQHALNSLRLETPPDLPPFQGGAAGLFGYDLCHHLERLPRPRVDDFAVPDLVVGLYDWIYAYDHHAKRGWVISTGFPETGPVRRAERAERRLAEALELLGDESRVAGPNFQYSVLCTRHSAGLAPQWPVPGLPGITSNFRRDDFLHAVRRAIEYVHAGDCFQVNVAQRLLAQTPASPVELYLKLRERNPATFGGYFDLGDFVIASASPERFLQVSDDGQVETRPIKGTRPRGRTLTEDVRLVAELQTSAKDRSENIMIVDLLRNDLGRVCEYGSIHVPALCEVETYETVHHLVSQVRGQLRQDKTALDLLQAAFPGGSVTGAPKIRAMQIIAELEPTTRGPYCGSLGWMGFNGAMDSNILIRTFTIGEGWVQFPVGGGIVAESDPEHEYEETLHKAAGMLRALQC
jgi:para-aminobenzoate synthetase component 1